MRHSSYLIQLPSSYYFRIRVPPYLHNVVGKTEIRYSLRCGSLVKAKPKARLLAGKLQRLFSYENIMELSQEQIQDIILGYMHDALNNDMDERMFQFEALPQETMKEDNQGVEYVLESLRAELGRSNHVVAVGEKVKKILAEKNLTVDTDSNDFKMLCWELLNAEIKVAETVLERNKGREVLRPPVRRTSQTQEKSSESFGKVADAFRDEAIRAKSWGKGTEAEYVTTLDFIKEFFGEEKPIHKVDVEQVRDFKNLMMKMPKHFRIRLKKEYKGLTLKEISELDIPESNRMTVKTLNSKYFGLVSALFNFAERNGYIDTNPATGLKIKQSRNIKASQERDPFNIEDLNLLFNSETYREDKHRNPQSFWLPLLALHTGCRLEELCQLYCDDVRKENGVWILDINDDDEKHLKNISSRRLVPLHPILLELGFHKFSEKQGREGHKRIFNDLKKVQNKFGHAPSKWFGDYKKRCGIVAESGKKTFHSFRHTAINCLAQQVVNDNVIKSLVGHAKKGETFGRYSSDLEPKVIFKEAVLKLNYKGLDLSHLKSSKYVAKR